MKHTVLFALTLVTATALAQPLVNASRSLLDWRDQTAVRLAESRRDKEFSQAELIHGTGVRRAFVNAIENGSSLMTEDFATQLAPRLEVSERWLLAYDFLRERFATATAVEIEALDTLGYGVVSPLVRSALGMETGPHVDHAAVACAKALSNDVLARELRSRGFVVLPAE